MTGKHRRPRVRPLAWLGVAAGMLLPLACAEGSSMDTGVFTRELALSPQVDAPAIGEQREVRVAASRTQLLAVWIDRHAIVAARVRDGELVDVKPMVLHRGNGPTVPEASAGLTVASNGSDFLVLWSERRVASGDLDVRFARVTSEGVVLDPGGRALAETAAYEHAPAALWTAYGWIVTYRSGPEVRMIRLDYAGRPWESLIHSVAAVAAGDAPVAMVPTEQGALVAFGEGNKIRLSRVGIAGPGEIISDVAELIGGELTGISMAALADGFLVGWSERMGMQGMTRVVRLNLDGLPIDARPLTISAHGDRAPTIISNGLRGVIAVEGAGEIDLIPISGGTELGFGEPRTIHGVAPFLATRAGEALLGFVRHEGGTIGSNTYFIRVARDGSVIEGSQRLLSRGPSVQMRPSIATGRYGSLVAWTDSLNADTTGMDVRYAHISPSGHVERTGTLGTALDDSSPAVTSDGQKFLVAWGDAEGAAHTALLDEVGSILRVSRLPFGAERLAAAWNGRVYLVTTPTLRAARLDRMGIPLDPHMLPLLVGHDAARLADQIALAPAGDGFLAAFHWNNGHDFVSSVRIGPNAVISNVPMTVGFGHSPAIAWDGDRHTVAWVSENAIKTVRLMPNGIWTDPPVALEVSSTAFALAPAADRGVLLSWADQVGVVRVGTLRDGVLAPMVDLTTTGGAPAIASYGQRFGVAYEIPGLEGTTAIRARVGLN